MPIDTNKQPAPAIILVEPQMGENIGAAARAMANFGLTDLRLVRPRDGWPNPQGAGGGERRDWDRRRRKVFDSAEAAIAGLEFRLRHDRAHPRSAETNFWTARGGGRASRAHLDRAGGWPSLRSRALGPDQRGSRACRCDRHLSRQPEVCVAQYRPGGAAYCVRVDDGRARRGAVDPHGRPGTWI